MKRLAVFARPPIPGRVKTRLSPALPSDLSAGLYQAMLADALGGALAAKADHVSLYWADGGEPTPDLDLPEGIAVRQQRGADLGERLAAAFAELLAGPEDRAVVIGADCPDLGPAVLDEAFAELGESDLVLGPARDGGYYLVGMRRPAPTLFEGVSWSTHQVLAQTLERAARANLEVGTLAELSDIDTPEDLVRFVARRCVSPPGPGPRTEAALREMGLLPARG